MTQLAEITENDWKDYFEENYGSVAFIAKRVQELNEKAASVGNACGAAFKGFEDTPVHVSLYRLCRYTGNIMMLMADVSLKLVPDSKEDKGKFFDILSCQKGGIEDELNELESALAEMNCDDLSEFNSPIYKAVAMLEDFCAELDDEDFIERVEN